MDDPLEKKVLLLPSHPERDGYLFLGASESIGEHKTCFIGRIKAKIFKSKKMSFQQAVPRPFAGEALDAGRADQKKGNIKMVKARDLVERIVLDEYAPACVVDGTFDALYFQGATEDTSYL